jgi:dienelactone hydrolase
MQRHATWCNVVQRHATLSAPAQNEPTAADSRRRFVRPTHTDEGAIMKLTPFAIAIALALLASASIARAEIKTQTLEYKDGEATLKGYLAYDDAAQGKRPGVLVVPEWWGVNDYVKSRADQLAGLGYVALVADIYGDGFNTTDAKVAGQKAGEAKQAGWLRSRGRLAIEQLRKHDRVDPQNVAAIGYCFGGSTVLELARAGEELKGVVSFHGSLDTKQPAQAGQVKAKILVLHGAADPFVPPQQLEAFVKEMKEAKADCQVVQYPEAQHAFTNPDVDKAKLDGAKYNKVADEQSWQAMRQFFRDLFGAAAPGT